MKSITIIIFLTIITVIFSPFVSAAPTLDDINQKVCNRFEEDVNKLSAIMDELRDREGITETRVAFGGVDTQIESADYWINFAAEAIAYQRAQEYKSSSQLKSSLQTLAGKVKRAKNEVREALNEK